MRHEREDKNRGSWVGSCMVFDDTNYMCCCIVIFDFFGFLIFLEEKSEICEDQAAMHIAKPFFPKRAFSFIYLAKTEGLWSRKVKTLSGTKAPPFY